MAGQPLNATFFVFRKREKGGVLTAATITYFVLILLALAAFAAINYQSLGAFFSWYGQIITASASGQAPNIDPSTIPPGLGILFLTLIPFMFVCYLLFAAYEAACLRWLIGGETGGFMGLSLGADTWRVYLTYWVWFGLYIAFSIVFTILTAAAAASGMAVGDQASAFAVAGPVVLVVTLVRIILMVFFGVRLAPAAATSVGLKKFAFFSAWTVSKGRFWSLFGAFLLTLLLFVVLEIVIIGALFAVIGFSALQFGPNADPSQVVATLFTPQNLAIIGVAYVVLLSLGMMIYLMFFGINARAVIAASEDGKIEGVNVANLAKTFD